MSYCLNPVCTQPQNSDVTFCQSCGAKLLLRERYRAVRQIGQGGFGKTFLAVDQDLPNKPACVIKQFSPQIQGASGLQKATELFEQEAVQLNILGKHPQIPELLAHFEQDGRLYLVQEYVKGRNLAEELAQGGAFSEAKIRELLVGLLPVLQYIHDNQVIHRDIKPENIIRRDDGKLFLVDFGAVKIVTGSTFFKMGTLIGSPEYSAPEQTRGKASFASDLYSLGVTCLHLLTNIEPINLFNDHEDKWVWQDYLISSINSSLTMVLDKMVEKAINRRYQSALELLQALGVSSRSQSNNNRSVKSKTTFQSATQIAPKRVKMAYKWGYEDESGRVITKLLFQGARDFSEGLAAVKYNGKWGFIDTTGKFVIESQFYEAYNFGSGLARVKIDQKYHFINSTGVIVLSPQFDDIGNFCEGLAKVGLEQHSSYRFDDFDRGFDWDECYDFDDFGKALYKDESEYEYKYGFINIFGDLVIEPQFDDVKDFKNGLSKIRLSKEYGFINKLGQIILKPKFHFIYDFMDGVALVELHKKCGLLSQDLEVILEPQFYLIYNNFSNGLAKVFLDGFLSQGLINKKGEIILEPRFNDIGEFKDGLAIVKSNELCGLINKKGEIILEPQFNHIGEFKDELAVFKIYNKNNSDYKCGYINPRGKVVIAANFLEAKPFDNGKAKVKVKSFFREKWRTIDKTGQFID